MLTTVWVDVLKRFFCIGLHNKDLAPSLDFFKCIFLITHVQPGGGKVAVVLTTSATGLLIKLSEGRKNSPARTSLTELLHRILKQIQTYSGGIGSIVKQSEDLYAYRVSSRACVVFS